MTQRDGGSYGTTEKKHRNEPTRAGPIFNCCTAVPESSDRACVEGGAHASPWLSRGRGADGNARNGATPKRITTDTGTVDLGIPRDRAFEALRVSWSERPLAAHDVCHRPLGALPSADCGAL